MNKAFDTENFSVDVEPQTPEYLWVTVKGLDVDGEVSVLIKKEDDGIVVDIIAPDGEAVAGTWATTGDLEVL